MVQKVHSKAILNFCVKCKNTFSLDTVQDIAVSANGTVGTCKGLCLFFKNIFNFCVKCKNPFISERVCDRAVWAKCLEKKVFVKTSAHFSRISFFSTFSSHLKFLREAQKHIGQDTLLWIHLPSVCPWSG